MRHKTYARNIMSAQRSHLYHMGAGPMNVEQCQVWIGLAVTILEWQGFLALPAG